MEWKQFNLNVDVSKTFDTIKKHEEKRVLEKAPIIRRKEFNEPDKVFKKNVDIKMDVTIPKAAIAFKINVKNINMKDTDIYTCLLNMVDLKVGPTSLFTEKMKQEGFITDTFDTSIIKCDDHFIVVIDFETTSDIDVVIEKVSVNDNVIKVKIRKEYKGIFATILSQKINQINVSYVGYKKDSRIIIEKE